ncbi:hypothetical protein ACLOJK_032394 [Asimina triloba]
MVGPKCRANRLQLARMWEVQYSASGPPKHATSDTCSGAETNVACPLHAAYTCYALPHSQPKSTHIWYQNLPSLVASLVFFQIANAFQRFLHLAMVSSIDPLVVGKVIGDVIDMFMPAISMSVYYGTKRVTNGCELKPSATIDRPIVQISGHPNSLYTLLVCECDDLENEDEIAPIGVELARIQTALEKHQLDGGVGW